MVNVLSKLNNLVKVKRIQANFPSLGRAWMHTVATLSEQDTLVNGFHSIGIVDLGDLNDPFATLPIVGLDGVVDASSLLQAGGHDTMDLIYNSYRVEASVLKMRVVDDLQRVTTYASTNHTSATTAGTTTSDPHTPFILCAIPSVEGASPADTWYKCMNHPLMIQSTVVQPDLNTSDIGYLTIEIPNHQEMMHAWSRQAGGEIGQEMSFTTMAAGPQTGEQPLIHLFICTLDASSDELTEVFIEMDLWQDTTFGKFTADNTGLAVTLGQDHKPTVTG